MKNNPSKAMFTLTLLCLSLLLWSSSAEDPSAKLKVLYPAELKNEFNKLDDITIAVANFGTVPWGRTVRGTVYLTNPLDACQILSPIDFKGTANSIEGESPILVAGRGNCTFVMKALNAQNAGARALIVVDDQEENENFILPVDDGHGGAIHIPVLLINKKTGELIEKYVSGGQQVANANQQVELSIKFDMPKKYDNIDYEIWLSSSDGFSFDFIKDLHRYHDILKKKATMTPHYAIWYCPICELLNFQDTSNPNCLSGGRYCSPDPDGNGPLTGKDTLLEDLRQICIYNHSAESWWDYHDNFRRSCLNAETLENCSKSTMDDIGVDQKKIMDCVNKSFTGPNRDKDDNTILREERNLFTQRGILTWPAVVINSMTYRGNLEPASNIFEAMCGGFTVTPSECEQSDPRPDPNNPPKPRKQPKSHLISIITIISLATVAFIILFFCYKRHVKREILQEMNTQITSTMHRYMAMKDDSKDATDDKKTTVFAIDDNA
eukprot:CAMPEP_0176437026 /NCGR_PEP_ID=MMETSP0127-20121128/18362_1 /TAXON_ID=938130 /ORGANISM="Platyophrya macrostoma, Strain WH" /LENGTH=493 /DNA_ID=CAMNT_0017820545 /DNA_START=33 /DNA_END=1514 /DNA_ORIENTATION=+